MGIMDGGPKASYKRGQLFNPNQWNSVSKEIIDKENRIQDTHTATLLQKKRLMSPESLAYSARVKSYFPPGKAQYEERSLYDLLHPKGSFSYNIHISSLPANDFDLRPIADPDDQDKQMIQPYRTSGLYGHKCCKYGINCKETLKHCKDFVRRSIIEESFYRDNGTHPLQPSWIEKDPLEMELQTEKVAEKMPKTTIKKDSGAIIGVWGNVFKSW